MSRVKLTLKIILAFTAVIAIAVSAVALAVGRIAESEFRSYNALYSNRAQRTAVALMDYYTRYNSWEGVQDQLAVLTPGSRGFGQGQQGVRQRMRIGPTVWLTQVGVSSPIIPEMLLVLSATRRNGGPFHWRVMEC